MTATVTTLIDLASQHGLGVAILLVGAQVVLDRLLPVELLIAHLMGHRRSASAPVGGAHRQVRPSRPSWESRFGAGLTNDRREGLRCME